MQIAAKPGTKQEPVINHGIMSCHLLNIFCEWGLAYIFNDPQSMPCLASHAQACPMPLCPAISWPRVGLSPLTTGAHGQETRELEGDILQAGPERGTGKRERGF